MRLNRQICIVILLTLSLLSCVKENMPYCDVFIDFKYDYNTAGSDKILEEVELLDLLIFLEDGSLYKRLSIQPQVDGTSMLIPLEGGTYHFVTWGNVAPSTHQEAAYRYDLNSGQLIHESEDIVFQDSMPGLFYGNSTDPFTIDGDTYISRVVSLVNNIKHIDIKIKTGHFTATNCELFAENCNHDNNNDPYGLLNSIPKKDTVSGYEVYSFNTHRLVTDLTNTELVLYGQKAGYSTMEKVKTYSLIDLLLKCPAINNLEDLDRCDHYTIILEFNPSGAIGININGWNVVDMPEEL